MRTRWNNWARRALAVALCSAVIGAVAFKALENWVRNRVIEYASAKFGGAIDMGNVELSFFRPQEIRDFLIRDPSKTSYIYIHSVRIEVGLLQVLGLGLEGRRLVLDRPEIHIVRSEHGVQIPLWQRFLQGGKPPSPHASSETEKPVLVSTENSPPATLKRSPLPWRKLDLDEIEVIDGRVYFEDRIAGKTIKLTRVQARLTPVNIHKPIGWKLSCQVQAPGRPVGKIRLSGKLHPFIGRSWAGPDLQLSFSYTFEGVELGPLSPFLPGIPVETIHGRANARGEVQFAQRRVTCSLEANLTHFSAAGGIFPDDGFGLDSTSARLRVTYDGETVNLERLALTTAGLSLKGGGHVARYDWTRSILTQLPQMGHRWQFDLRSDLAQTEQLFRRFLPRYPVLIDGGPATWSGPAKMSGRIEGSGAHLTGQGSGQLSGQQFSWKLMRQPAAAPRGRVTLGDTAYEVLPGMKHFRLRRTQR